MPAIVPMQSRHLNDMLSAAEDRKTATIKASSDTMDAAIRRALAPRGATLASIDFVADMINSVDGHITAKISAYADSCRFDFEVKAPVADGIVAVSDALILTAFSEAQAADKSAPVKFDGVGIRKMPVDLSKIQATRKGDIVTYTTSELPTWNMFVDASVLAAAANHMNIASAILAGIRGFCLTDYNRVAEFTATAFTLPVAVESNVQAALVPASEIPGWNVPQTDMEVDTAILMANLQMTAGKAVRPQEDISDREFDARNRLKDLIAVAATFHMSAKLGITAAKVEAVDFSAVKFSDVGNLVGTAKAEMSFYGNDSRETLWLEIPVTDKGIAAEKIEKAKITLQAEQIRAAELKILSDDQARAEFEAFKAKQLKHDAALINAGYNLQADNAGSTLFNQPMQERYRVQRAMLPLAANEFGKFISIQGYVYEITPTLEGMAGSTDPNENPFCLLVLRPEKKSVDADCSSIYGSLSLPL